MPKRICFALKIKWVAVNRLMQKLSVLVVALFVSVACHAAKPNIVFILADDLGYGDLGCYGQEQIKTPCLDKMATEGLRFTQAYAGSTVCAPSRCALMTGCHTGHARIRGNGTLNILKEDVTVAELLKEAGYYTALIGKWGLGEEKTDGAPQRKGFDESFGYLNQTHAHDYYTDYLIKNGERFEIPENKNGTHKIYSHDLFATAALDFVRANRERPFFLYLAFTIPHAKMQVPRQEPYAKENWPEAEKNKAAMITRMDRDIGRLFDALKEFGLDNNTIVFFASDNGPHHEGGVKAEFFKSSGPLRGTKRDLTEGGIREPAMVRWPGKIKPGVSDFVWAFWDFMPTACELAGTKAPEGIDGQSIVPTLLGKAQKTHEFFYWEFHETGHQQAVRMGDWKFIRMPSKGAAELYDLKTDLHEDHDIAAQHPDVVKQISNYLKTARTPSEKWKMN
jgi:arylsulfatase A-like enzyme